MTDGCRSRKSWREPRDDDDNDDNGEDAHDDYGRGQSGGRPGTGLAPLGNHERALASIYLRTWGCSHNNSDSEYMAGLLAAYGFGLTDDPDQVVGACNSPGCVCAYVGVLLSIVGGGAVVQAGLWLLNSCAVKTPSEESFNGLVREGLAAGKHVVVAGCVPQASPHGSVVAGLSLVSEWVWRDIGD
jgi:hypothetical protein